MKESKIKAYKTLLCNPYLPGWEYVPDGEPYVFGDRLYVFGSHDEFGAEGYCTAPYVGWSAPLKDLSDWRYEGMILKKGEDPYDPDGNQSYYAPDVTQGPDGRYYLYYSIENSFVISVAVADRPEGPYHFYGHVQDKKGHVIGSEPGDSYQFDPAVLVEEGHIYLYSGQDIMTDEVNGRKVKGAQVCELEPDMMTMKTPQKTITSRQENCFEQNPFFEAASIRKIDGVYYFIYSPLPNVHNLCYAVSAYPDRDFVYQGVLVSNANLWEEPDRQDMVKESITKKNERKAESYWGNNHGSLVKIGEDYYIFYHRHTNRCSWNRQGCAEKLIRTAEGRFLQAETTSIGLRGEPFPAVGVYPAYMACVLQKKETEEYQPYQFYKYTEADPYLTQESFEEKTELGWKWKKEPYIANLRDGARAGYRYFEFHGTEKAFGIQVRGNAQGKIVATARLTDTVKEGNRKLLSEIMVDMTEAEEETSECLTGWREYTGTIQATSGVVELQITFYGEGYIDLKDVCFS